MGTKLDPVLQSYLRSIRGSMKSTSISGNSRPDPYLNRIDILDIWANELQENEACQQLFQELVIDSFSTVFFSYSGLYKYANATLRSSLETALRIAYFAFHPVEYQWWKKEKNWQSDTKNVWGNGYNYFISIDKIENIDKKLKDAKLPGLFNGMYNIPSMYSVLSKSVHTLYSSLQTGHNNFSPNFDLSTFKKWSTMYGNVMSRINLLYICVFEPEYSRLEAADKTKILDIGIASEKTKTTLGL